MVEQRNFVCNIGPNNRVFVREKEREHVCVWWVFVGLFIDTWVGMPLTRNAKPCIFSSKMLVL
jgi:hypothetical protein